MDSTINFLPGRSIVIFLPNSEQHKGRFAITELRDITASHNEKTFETSAGYPIDREGKNINDRNYTDDPAAKAEVKIMAQHLAPEQLLSASRVADGSPIITQTGIVISGNNRTMSLKLAAADFTENYEHYKNILREELPAFGIESKDYDARNFSQPVLIRIDYDITDPTTSDLSKFNKDSKKTERPIDIALKLRKMLAESERCTTVISDIVKNYETFSEFRSNFNDETRLRDTLLECNIMVRQEMNRYWYERGFTDEGMDLLENMLSGIILEPDALRAGMDPGVKQMRNILIVSLPVLIKNKTLPQKYSLIPLINKAIILEAQIKASGLIRMDYLAQEKLFEEKPDVNTVYMNALLHEGRNKFKDAIERYNTSADAALMGNMFGDTPEPEQMFNVFIKKSVPQNEAEMIERYFGKKATEPEPFPVAPKKVARLLPTLPEKMRTLIGILNPPVPAMAQGGALNGKAKNMSVEDIAALHKVPVKQIRRQLEKGMNVELEHTSDLVVAKQIAKDHLVESPVYYDKLEEIEETFTQGGLLAPNGQPSKLTPHQYHLVRTPEFKTWFGDWENDPKNASKVVDENGEPLVIYHGTTVKFNEFRIRQLGFHFGTLDTSSSVLSDKLSRLSTEKHQPSYMMAVFLNIKNPLAIIDIARWTSHVVSLLLLRYNGISQQEYNELQKIKDGDKKDLALLSLIKQKGYDGFEYENAYEGGGISYMVFDTEQVKLADGINTTFDASNPDIRFAQGGTVENEIEQEKQNIDAAIAAALRSEDHYFEGVSLSQLKEDKVLLETDPRKYFLQQSGRMFKQSIDSRLSEQDRQLALRLGQEYNRIFTMLMQRQVNSSIIKNEAGGEACGVCEHDNVAVSLAHGGMVKGRRHSEGGEKFNLDGQGPRVELEAGEPVVPEQLLNDNRQYTITGTNRQVLNKILNMAGVSLNDKVTQVKSGDVVICRLSTNDNAERKYSGTLKQIVSAVNTSSGECNMVEPGAKVQELQHA